MLRREAYDKHDFRDFVRRKIVANSLEPERRNLMKAVILAGGYGTRLSEETAVRPKPMVDIGGRPILWHILKLYSYHGINDDQKKKFDAYLAEMQSAPKEKPADNSPKNK